MKSINFRLKKYKFSRARELIFILFILGVVLSSGYYTYQKRYSAQAASKLTPNVTKAAIKKRLGSIPYIDPLSACPAGTKFVRKATDAYVDGRKFSTNLCAVYDVRGRFFLVSPIIAAQLRDLLNASNRNVTSRSDLTYALDTIVVGAGSGYRTNAEQKSVYDSGNSMARPGYSNHQSGLSVDVSCATSPDHVVGLLEGRGKVPKDYCWSWLRDNSAKYGLLNNMVVNPGKEWAEAWHLSPTGN